MLKQLGHWYSDWDWLEKNCQSLVDSYAVLVSQNPNSPPDSDEWNYGPSMIAMYVDESLSEMPTKYFKTTRRSYCVIYRF